jgi:hypothetical protein
MPLALSMREAGFSVRTVPENIAILKPQKGVFTKRCKYLIWGLTI